MRRVDKTWRDQPVSDRSCNSALFGLCAVDEQRTGPHLMPVGLARPQVNGSVGGWQVDRQLSVHGDGKGRQLGDAFHAQRQIEPTDGDLAATGGQQFGSGDRQIGIEAVLGNARLDPQLGVGQVVEPDDDADITAERLGAPSNAVALAPEDLLRMCCRPRRDIVESAA